MPRTEAVDSPADNAAQYHANSALCMSNINATVGASPGKAAFASEMLQLRTVTGVVTGREGHANRVWEESGSGNARTGVPQNGG